MDTGVIIVIGLCALLVVWYGGAHLYNRRRGQRLYRWLESGLGALGGEWEAGYLGSPATGARINVVRADPPFRRLELTLLLQSREILPLWVLHHLQGRRDGLIIRATLRSPHRDELEIVPSKGPIALGLRREQERPWTWRDGPYGLAIAYRGSRAGQFAAGLEPWLADYGPHLDRLSWRTRDPHLQLQLKLPGLRVSPSETVLTHLQAAVRATAQTAA